MKLGVKFGISALNNDPCQACGFSASQKVTQLGRWVLEVNLLSGNKIGSNDRQGWKYRNAQTRYKRAFNLLDNPPPAAPGEKRRLVITRYFGKRKRPYDRDNLIWGCKPLIDILTQRSWLFDDDPKHVERIYHQKPSETGFDHVTIELFNYA